MSKELNSYGICHHADGWIVEAVPEQFGGDYDWLVEQLRITGAATFTDEAMELFEKDSEVAQ